MIFAEQWWQRFIGKKDIHEKTDTGWSLFAFTTNLIDMLSSTIWKQIKHYERWRKWRYIWNSFFLFLFFHYYDKVVQHMSTLQPSAYKKWVLTLTNGNLAVPSNYHRALREANSLHKTIKIFRVNSVVYKRQGEM